MKIRNGFVSNSSSSSFIIVVDKDKEPCSHCGLKAPNIVELIDNSGRHQNEVEYNKEELISYYTDDIERIEFDLEELNCKDDNEIVHSWFSTVIHDNGDESKVKSSYTVKDKKCDLNRTLNEHRKLLQKISDVPSKKEVFQVSISYHDEFLNDLIKTHTIIEQWEG